MEFLFNALCFSVGQFSENTLNFSENQLHRKSIRFSKSIAIICPSRKFHFAFWQNWIFTKFFELFFQPIHRIVSKSYNFRGIDCQNKIPLFQLAKWPWLSYRASLSSAAGFSKSWKILSSYYKKLCSDWLKYSAYIK